MYVKQQLRRERQNRSGITKTSADGRVHFWCSDLTIFIRSSPLFPSFTTFCQHTCSQQQTMTKKKKKMNPKTNKNMLKLLWRKIFFERKERKKSCCENDDNDNDTDIELWAATFSYVRMYKYVRRRYKLSRNNILRKKNQFVDTVFISWRNRRRRRRKKWDQILAKQMKKKKERRIQMARQAKPNQTKPSWDETMKHLAERNDDKLTARPGVGRRDGPFACMERTCACDAFALLCLAASATCCPSPSTSIPFDWIICMDATTYSVYGFPVCVRVCDANWVQSKKDDV